MERHTRHGSIGEMPNPAVQNHNRHRRGLSLDQGITQRRNWTSTCPEPLRDKLDNIPQFPHEHARPSTPVKQTYPDSLPHTPVATSPTRNLSRNARTCKTAQSSPTRQPAMRGAVSMQRTKSLQEVSGNTFSHLTKRIQFPSGDADLPPTSMDFKPQLPDAGDVFSDFTFPLPEDTDEPFFHSPGSPMTSFLSFPEDQRSSVKDHEDARRKVPIPPIAPLYPTSQYTADSSPCSSPTKSALSPRAMSISSLNLEGSVDASIEETGITLNDIATFIQGPDPEDNKWVCTYDGCNRRFGRKENIKSHVQTHLGDRQFKCNHCSKCFVRGHDLKRHAKIHTGVKPYPCDCGNSFARHDALTRHKQRGMCSGAFEGAVRRVRRGRPRKTRHKGDERQERSSKIKRRMKTRPTPVSTASQLPCESLASPLSDGFDTARAASPVKDTAHFSSDSIGLPPDVFTFTPPASPSYSNSSIASPTRSYHSMLAGDGGYSCLSPTRRALDDIPEETSEQTPKKIESLPPIKGEHKAISPVQLLWPSAAESTLVDGPGKHDLDVFTNQTFDHDQLPSLGAPSSTAGISESNHSTEYEDDIFFNPTQADDLFNPIHADDPVIDHDFFSATFPTSLDDSRHGFFDKYQAELSSSAI